MVGTRADEHELPIRDSSKCDSALVATASVFVGLLVAVVVCGAFDLFHHDEPDRPWPQCVESQDGALIVSSPRARCDWQLEGGSADARPLHVEIPPDWAAYLESQRSLIREPPRRLVALAENVES
jgi:hypothetical protein